MKPRYFKVEVGDTFILKGTKFKYLSHDKECECDTFKIIEKSKNMSRSSIANQLFRWFYQDRKLGHIDYTWLGINEILLRKYIPEIQEMIK